MNIGVKVSFVGLIFTTIIVLFPLVVDRWVDVPPNDTVSFSEVVANVQRGHVQSITAKGHTLSVLLHDGTQFYSKLEDDETIANALERYGDPREKRRTAAEQYEERYDTLLHDSVVDVLPYVLAIGSWLFLVYSPARTGLGLVTYCPVVKQFFYAFFGALGIPYIPHPAAHALKWAANMGGYLLTLTFDGWVFAIPAMICATIGLRTRTWMWVNRVTVVLSVLMLFWSVYSFLTGGAWFA